LSSAARSGDTTSGTPSDPSHSTRQYSARGRAHQRAPRATPDARTHSQATSPIPIVACKRRLCWARFWGQGAGPSGEAQSPSEEGCNEQKNQPDCRESVLASAVPGSHRSGWRSLHSKEGVDGSSPSEGFEKVAANRDLSRASVASAGDKGRTRSHADGTERTDQLSLPYTKEELTGVAQLLWILLGAAIAPVVLDICERMHSRSELRATHKQRDAPGKNRTCARGLGSCASDAETCCKRRTLALEHSMRASQCASRTAKSFCGAVQGDPRGKR
jgi:hypothetical protein